MKSKVEKNHCLEKPFESILQKNTFQEDLGQKYYLWLKFQKSYFDIGKEKIKCFEIFFNLWHHARVVLL